MFTNQNSETAYNARNGTHAEAEHVQHATRFFARQPPLVRRFTRVTIRLCVAMAQHEGRGNAMGAGHTEQEINVTHSYNGETRDIVWPMAVITVNCRNAWSELESYTRGKKWV